MIKCIQIYYVLRQVTTVYILCTNYYVSLVHIYRDEQVKNSNIVIFILYKRLYSYTVKNVVLTNKIYLQWATT